MVKRKWLYTTIVAAILLLVALILLIHTMESKKSDKGGNMTSSQQAHPELSAWVADWQWQSGLHDLKAMKGGLTSVQMFGAYFDETDRLYFTKSFQEALPSIKEACGQPNAVPIYLTVVNDRIVKGGATVQKDASLLKRLTATSESRAKHIDTIMEAVEAYSFQGVELDYENISQDDWSGISQLYTELYARLHAKGMPLRIVLESRAPIERLTLPEGPVYVMMAYNLYGGHSGPGPKADEPFIGKLAGRLKHLPGEAYIALSAGGFDWPATGKATALTEKQAAELARSALEPPERDAASMSLHFTYQDERKMKHTVWYADELTLSSWVKTARKSGVDRIALWKLGELQEPALQRFGRFPAE